MDLVETVVRKIRENDNFGRMVGIQVVEARKGYSRVMMEVEDRHLNSVGITHGGPFFHWRIWLLLSLQIPMARLLLPLI